MQYPHVTRVGKPQDQGWLSRSVTQTSLAETWPVQTSTTPYQLSFGSHTALRLLAVFCYGLHGNYDTTSVTLGQVAFNQDNEYCARVTTDTAEKTTQVQLQGDEFLEESHLFIYLFTYSLTHSMEQNPSWEANRFSATQYRCPKKIVPLFIFFP